MISMAQDTDSDESEYDEEEAEIEDIIAEVEDECSLVFSNPENAGLLDKIFDLARTSYDKDRKGWKDFFTDLKIELIATDDEDNTHDILANYLRKAKLELS